VLAERLADFFVSVNGSFGPSGIVLRILAIIKVGAERHREIVVTHGGCADTHQAVNKPLQLISQALRVWCAVGHEKNPPQ